MTAEDATYTVILTAEQRHALHEALKDTIEENEEVVRDEGIEGNEALAEYARTLRPVLRAVATAEAS